MDDFRLDISGNIVTLDITNRIRRIFEWVAAQENKALFKALAEKGIRLCDHNCLLKEINELTYDANPFNKTQVIEKIKDLARILDTKVDT